MLTNDAAAGRLREFRRRLHGAMRRRADALFELCDAALTKGAAPSSKVHLSLEAVHRRGWGSLYGALRHGRIDTEALRDLLARHLLKGVDPPVYAVDVSAWPRNDAEASPGRGVPLSPVSALRRAAHRGRVGLPILVAGLSFERGSWVAPVDARRVRPDEDANDVAAEQVGALAHRLRGSNAAPLFVFDAGYDPVRLRLKLEGQRAQILTRLHSGRAFYAEPEVPPKRPVGRPFRHGRKFSCKDPNAWPRPTAERHVRSADYGSVRVRAWSGLHPKTRRAGERYGATTAAVVRGTVILVEVGRLPRGERRRKPKALWLWWHGEGEPNLDLLWRSYCRRFDVEHFVKFLKGTLGWTAPRVRHPEQADRWTWLVLTAYAQLLLARGIVVDRRLPWEHPLPTASLTPTGVLRSFANAPACVGHASRSAETPRKVAWQAQRQPLWAGQTLPSHEEGRLNAL